MTVLHVKNQKSLPEQTLGLFDFVLKEDTEMHVQSVNSGLSGNLIRWHNYRGIAREYTK